MDARKDFLALRAVGPWEDPREAGAKGDLPLIEHCPGSQRGQRVIGSAQSYAGLGMRT